MSEAEVWTWRDPDGNEHVLSGDAEGVRVMVGVRGRFMPPARHVEDSVPFQPGTRYRHSQFDPRKVSAVIKIESDSAVALRSKMRELMRLFNPMKGESELEVLNPDGFRRILKCIYESGMEGDEEFGLGVYMQRAVLSLHAPDPFWMDGSDISYSYGNSDTAFFPFPPLELSPTAILSDFSVNNDGDVDAWPVWVMHGPGTDPTFTNNTTGKSLSLDYSLVSGQSIIIDTRPGFKTVRLNDGTNLYGSMTPSSSLWPLAEGSNDVSLSMAGTDENSSLDLAFRRKYLSV